MAAPSKTDKEHRRIADNRRARRDYFIDETLEAGLVLQGSEVKSLRQGGVTLNDSYAEVREGELFLVNAHIPEYTQAGRNNHEPKQPRKLLLKKREVERLSGAIQRKGITVVPLDMYFNERGRAKVTLGLARGKRQYDKRQTDKARDWNRQKQRVLRDNS